MDSHGIGAMRVTVWMMIMIMMTMMMRRLLRQEVKRIMEKTLSDLQLPMDIADECMLQREKRTDIDRVHDEVEKCLTKVTLTTLS